MRTRHINRKVVLKKMAGKPIEVYSFFSGAGFLDLGFEEAGFDIVFVNEFNKQFLNVYQYARRNNEKLPQYGYSNEDIRNFLSDENWYSRFPRYNDRTNKLIGFIGGPPCQAYSIAGRAQDPNSMKNDYRNYLFESYAKVVAHYRPKLFVFENVSGLLSATLGDIPVRQRIFDAFEKIGYDIRTPEDLKKSVFCSADYNTPQIRNRVIIFGVRKDTGISVESLYEELINLKMKRELLTVRDAIGNFPKYKPLKEAYKVGNKNISHELIEKNSLTHHNCRYSNLRDQKVFKEWISKDMNHMSTEEKQQFYTKITGKKSVHIKYRNLEWDKPSPTVVAHLYKDGLMFIHPDVQQLRTITIREAAALQTFPNDFDFIGSDAYAFKMIGNAVPVEFASAIAEAVYKVLIKNE